jgi:NAD-dependent deacetylase
VTAGDPSPDEERVRERLGRARSVCVLTGSGISAESGLPTFRGAGGLWRTHRVEQLASPQGFARDPELVWTWYDERRAKHATVEPNAGHRALAALEPRIADFTLVTQNVDSLHFRAGSRNVLELHGNLREARCDRCGRRRPLEPGVSFAGIEHACGGLFRPDIVWFGEPLPRDVLERAAAAASRADVLLIVGTSGQVQPAASLATLAPEGALVVEINPETTPLSAYAQVTLRGGAAGVLPRLMPAT